MPAKKNIIVLFGGQSSEHEVSRCSARSVIENIDKEKYEVFMIGITKEGRWLPYNGPLEALESGFWEEAALKNHTKLIETENSGYNNTPEQLLKLSAGSDLKRIDAVFPVLHGRNGEDGTIQGFFELAGIPYAGCGVLSSALGMDKGFAKIIFEKAGIPQGNHIVITSNELKEKENIVINDIEQKLGYPCFIKPCNAGSSVGVSKACDRVELKTAFKAALQHDRRIIAEQYINGRELECAVMGNENPLASVVGEVKPCNEFYDYHAKYDSNSTSETIIPAMLDKEVSRQIREYAVTAFKALDCRGLSRVDFFIENSTGKIYINEINTMPGFTSISMYPKLWEASGIPYKELIDRLISLALENHLK